MDFTIAIALGVFGSLHCAAMCGPLLLALPVPRAVPGGLSPAACLSGGPRDDLLPAGPDRRTRRQIHVSGGLATLAVHCPGRGGSGWISPVQKNRRLRARSPVGRTVESGDGLAIAAAGFSFARPAGPLERTLAVRFGLCGRGRRRGPGESGGRYDLHCLVWSGHAADDAGHRPFRAGLATGVPAQIRGAIPAGVCLLGGLLILRGLALGIPYVSPLWWRACQPPAACASMAPGEFAAMQNQKTPVRGENRVSGQRGHCLMKLASIQALFRLPARA